MEMDEKSEEIGNQEADYFFDTYALIEILKDNINYLPFKEKSVTITLFNLAELFYYVLTNHTKEAETIYSEYRSAVVDIDDETLKEAVALRKELKKELRCWRS